MQPKVILALLLLSAFGAKAQQDDKRNYQKETVTKPQALPQKSGDFHEVGSRLPQMRVVTAKGEVITDASLKNDANLFVMMFNPTCEHCEDMTRALEANMELFKASRILLMAAPAMGPYLAYFDKNTKYTQYPAIKVGLDSAQFIERTFNYVTLPQINIYNRDRVLVRSFSGITTIDSLRAFIQ